MLGTILRIQCKSFLFSLHHNSTSLEIIISPILQMRQLGLRKFKILRDVVVMGLQTSQCDWRAKTF